MVTGNKRLVFLFVCLASLLALILATPAMSKKQDGSKCLKCHEKRTPGIVGQWRDSKHGKNDIGCINCHEADPSDPDAFKHNGFTIAIIVSPKDCAQCHEAEVKEFTESHHAKATQFIGSLDNMLGVAVEGAPAAILGCQQCHGSTVKVIGNGKLDPTTWPNSGMGRINPDGSNGSCSACHARHGFSKGQARQPENCGKCHMGPDHPQIEIYNESKHGILFRANVDKMNLDSDSWIPGKDYSAAPTCATCHMSATEKQPATHDVGARISWTLRPVISNKLPQWESKRKNMQDVCSSCHSKPFTNNFYNQFDEAVNLYNEKFAEPAKAIMDELRADNLITKTPFDDKIEWTFFELWHHEGRRARHGASMMGPDYTQWHGFYEVAKHYYTKFLPEAEELKKGISQKGLQGDHHKWKKGLSKKDMENLLNFYENRYGQ